MIKVKLTLMSYQRQMKKNYFLSSSDLFCLSICVLCVRYVFDGMPSLSQNYTPVLANIVKHDVHIRE